MNEVEMMIIPMTSVLCLIKWVWISTL